MLLLILCKGQGQGRRGHYCTEEQEVAQDRERLNSPEMFCIYQEIT